MIATVAQPVAYADGDVLTLSFQNQSDVAAFKKLIRRQGPSEDLRGAIQQVLGVRVKYVAEHDSDPTPPPAGPGDSEGPAAGPAGPGDGPAAPPPPVAGPARPARTRCRGAGARDTTAGRRPSPSRAVAAIPADDAAAPAAQFPVDDEPDEAASAAVRTLTLAREGDVHRRARAAARRR